MYFSPLEKKYMRYVIINSLSQAFHAQHTDERFISFFLEDIIDFYELIDVSHVPKSVIVRC